MILVPFWGKMSAAVGLRFSFSYFLTSESWGCVVASTRTGMFDVSFDGLYLFLAYFYSVYLKVIWQAAVTVREPD